VLRARGIVLASQNEYGNALGSTGALEPFIDLAPGAEGLELARSLAGLVRENVVRHPAKRAEFDRLRGSIGVIADDAGVALTLRFDFGRLIIHAGLIGVPDVTLRGTTSALETLSALPMATPLGLSAGVFDGTARRAARAAATAMRKGDLKVYGLGLHPRLVARLLRILSRR
jgi:hypothetical protein